MAPVVDHVVDGDRLGAAELHADLEMVLQVGADAGHVGDHRDAVAAQQIRRADAGKLQELRRIERAAGEDDLALGVGGARRRALTILNADGAPALEQDARRQRVELDLEVWPYARLLQIAGGGRPAAAVLHRQLEVADTLLLRPLKSGLRGMPACSAASMKASENGCGSHTLETESGPPRRAGRPRRAPGPRRAGNRAARRERPAGIAELAPVVVVLVLAADVEQPVDRARAAQHLAARLDDLPVVELGLRLGFVEPIDLGVVEQLAEAERN